MFLKNAGQPVRMCFTVKVCVTYEGFLNLEGFSIDIGEWCDDRIFHSPKRQSFLFVIYLFPLDITGTSGIDYYI